MINRGLTSGRVDDNEETIKHRLATFHDNSVSILEHFGEKVVSIWAEREPNVIFNDVVRTLDTLPKESKEVKKVTIETVGSVGKPVRETHLNVFESIGNDSKNVMIAVATVIALAGLGVALLHHYKPNAIKHIYSIFIPNINS